MGLGGQGLFEHWPLPTRGMAGVYNGLITQPLTFLGVFARPDARRSLAEMRALVARYPPSSQVPEPSDNDLLRFLVARQYNVGAAVDMYMAWRKWYYQTPLPRLTGSLFRDYVPPGQMYPCNILEFDIPGLREFNERHSNFHCFLGEDKDGAPIYWEKTGRTSNTFATMCREMSDEDMHTLHIRQQELMMERLRECSLRHGKDLESYVVVADLDDMTLSLDPSCLRMFLALAQIDAANYPERLKKMFFINAPLYFMTIWALIWPFLNPATVSKITILGTDVLPTLREHIEDSSIPAEYGGSMTETSWLWPNNHMNSSTTFSTSTATKPYSHYCPEKEEDSPHCKDL